MKPRVRPAPSDRSTANQLYSELAPLVVTAAAQAGFCGMIWPVELSPSCQHRNVRLPGFIMAPCASAVPVFSRMAVRLASSTVTAARIVLRLLVTSVPSLGSVRRRLGALSRSGYAAAVTSGTARDDRRGCLGLPWRGPSTR